MHMILPYPISANRYWRIMNNRMVRSVEATAYKKRVELVARLSKQGEPLVQSVSIAIILHPKTTLAGLASKTRLDLDNALKVVIDALNGIAYIDDKQVAHIDARVGEPIKDGGLTVTVVKHVEQA